MKTKSGFPGNLISVANGFDFRFFLILRKPEMILDQNHDFFAKPLLVLVRNYGRSRNQKWFWCKVVAGTKTRNGFGVKLWLFRRSGSDLVAWFQNLPKTRNGFGPQRLNLRKPDLVSEKSHDFCRKPDLVLTKFAFLSKIKSDRDEKRCFLSISRSGFVAWLWRITKSNLVADKNDIASA